MAAPKEGDATYPCPACGKKLYGWLAAKHPLDGSKLILDRCENCLLVVTRGSQPPDAETEINLLDRSSGTIVAPNRESFQGGIGGAQWSGLEPERRRLHLSPRAAGLLLSLIGVEVAGSRTPFSRRSYKEMLQTLINAFTLRDNFFRNARAGLLPRRTPKERAAYALDATVSTLVLIPLAIIALPLELVGSLVGRGGVMELEIKN